MEKIPFKNKIESFKQVPLQDILAALGFFPENKKQINWWYISPFRKEKTASFKIDVQKNLWYDFGSGEGGNIFSFLEKYKNLDFRASIDFLDNLYSYSSSIPLKSLKKLKNEVKEDDSTLEISSVEKLNHPALIQYISRRKIDKKLVSHICMKSIFLMLTRIISE